MSQHQRVDLGQTPGLSSKRTDTLLETNDIVTSKQIDSSIESYNIEVVKQNPATRLQLSIGPIENFTPTTIQPSDSSGGSGNILSLGTIKHLDQIVVDRSKENQHQASVVSITTAAQLESNNSSLGRANNWSFHDQSGEENILPKSSFDKAIIESSSSQHTAPRGVGGESSSSVEVQAIAPPPLDSVTGGHLNRTPTKHPGSFGAGATQIPSSDKDFRSSPEQLIAQKSASPHFTTAGFNNPADSKRLRFKSLLDTKVASLTNITPTTTTTTTATTTCDSSSGELNSGSRNSDNIFRANGEALQAVSDRISRGDRYELADKNQEEILLETLYEDTQKEEEEEYKSDDEEENDEQSSHAIGQFESYTKFNGRKVGNSFRKSTARLLGGHTFIRIQRLLGVFNSKFVDNYRETPYVPQESKDLLTGDSKYSTSRKKQKHALGGKTFRGSYKYSRAEISMAIFKKLIDLLFQKSTLALIGAFLIHITLGTVYTLSNINSYLTSYMRLHGSPMLTYGGSMWISSFYAIGQGFSMVLGGYLEKRFSARLACFLGCIIHSGSIMSTSLSVNHGSLAVLLSYGFLPGFGCGLAYMTPMSNGFGWFPNRRGLVAGVILAGFGIGTFVFNIAQTAYVNPDNLSPTENSDGYFTQDSILTKVPGLFLFIGSIYAAMQFVGCCLLFRPPSDHSSGKSLDERPILETEMSVSRAVRTREFAVLFLVYGIITQGVLFVNSMIKEYGQLFIGDDMYLAWTGSMASIANALGRLLWGLAIDRYTFTQCFTCITCIFGMLMFVMPFEFVLSSKHLYLLCTLGIFGSFSGWMSTFPVHLSRTFGRLNSGMLYGLIFISQSFGGIASAFGAHYLIDHYSRFVPFFCVVFLEILGLAIYHLFYPRHRYL